MKLFFTLLIFIIIANISFCEGKNFTKKELKEIAKNILINEICEYDLKNNLHSNIINAEPFHILNDKEKKNRIYDFHLSTPEFQKNRKIICVEMDDVNFWQENLLILRVENGGYEIKKARSNEREICPIMDYPALIIALSYDGRIYCLNRNKEDFNYLSSILLKSDSTENNFLNVAKLYISTVGYSGFSWFIIDNENINLFNDKYFTSFRPIILHGDDKIDLTIFSYHKADNTITKWRFIFVSKKFIECKIEIINLKP